MMNTMSIYLAMVRSYEEELVTAETLAHSSIWLRGQAPTWLILRILPMGYLNYM